MTVATLFYKISASEADGAQALWLCIHRCIQGCDHNCGGFPQLSYLLSHALSIIPVLVRSFSIINCHSSTKFTSAVSMFQHIFGYIMTPKAITESSIWPDKTLRDTHWKNMAFSSYLSDYDCFLFELLHCMQLDIIEIQKAQWVPNALLKAAWIARPKGWWSVVWRLCGGQ